MTLAATGTGMSACSACGKAVTTWQQWWQEDCEKSDQGHQLSREEWTKLPVSDAPWKPAKKDESP